MNNRYILPLRLLPRPMLCSISFLYSEVKCLDFRLRVGGLIQSVRRSGMKIVTGLESRRLGAVDLSHWQPNH
jgi:hypothetical protein